MRNFLQRSKRQFSRVTALKGFSLIEILVVVSIIALGSAILLVSLQQARQHGRNSRRVQDLSQIALAMELYMQDHGDMPPGADGTEYTNGDPYWIPGLVPKYISAVPSDPVDAPPYQYHYLRVGVNY